MNAIEKKIEWTTGSGKKASIQISLATSKKVFCDGDEHETPCCDLSIVAVVDGAVQGYTISRKPIKIGGASYPATIGRLVIPAAQLAEVDSALAEIYATPEWQDNEARKARARIADAKHAKHMDFMRQQMGW